MSHHKFHPWSIPTCFGLTCLIGAGFWGVSLAMNLGVRCQADPDFVFLAVKIAAQAMPQWRSVRIIEDKRVVKAVVLNQRNFGVPILIQVQPQDEPHGSVEVHVYWEQTMDPVNYPDLLVFMDAFWEQQKASGLNCIDAGTDVGL